MSRASSIAVVLVVWVAIYLPRLGSLEIKGEEGRRILPAIQMLETGNYLVPRVGSEPYLRKPPLINWLVAASFKIFGSRNEWTARLPSAICVVVVAMVFVTVARPSLGARGSTVAGLVWLTNVGLIEKGRLIEIEALYASLFALAFVCWLSFWEQKRSAWLTWFVPWVFLGLGWLAKGPLHLLFFYAIVLAVLWRAGQVHDLLNFPHFIGLMVMLSIFALWAIPFAHFAGEAHTAYVWSKQFSGRLTDNIHWKSWALNIPKSLVYFLPWLLLVPFVCGRDRRFQLQPLVLGISVPLMIVDLIPGTLPRYTLPLVAPFAWLIGSLLSEEAGRWWWRRVIAGIVLATCVVFLSYVFAIVPRLRPRLKPIAAQIESIVPQSERLYAIDPDYQPFLFYLHRPIVYLSSVENLPATARFFLLQSDEEDAALNARTWPQRPIRVLAIKDYRDWRVSIFEIPHERPL
jgi:4-amino-4-deoxy-L-arabinose transferase-like glycosyltransferase